jgi:hypothetical protein
MSSSKLMMRPVILSRREKLAFLLTIFCAGLQRGRRRRRALGLALPGGRRLRIGGRRRHRDGGWRVLRNHGGAGRRRQRLRLHRSGGRHALPWQRSIGRRQQPALRQFRHLFFVVGLRAATGNGAGRTRRGIGKNIADLRARRRRKRDRQGGEQGRKTGQGNGSKHLARL